MGREVTAHKWLRTNLLMVPSTLEPVRCYILRAIRDDGYLFITQVNIGDDVEDSPKLREAVEEQLRLKLDTFLDDVPDFPSSDLLKMPDGPNWTQEK